MQFGSVGRVKFSFGREGIKKDREPKKDDREKKGLKRLKKRERKDTIKGRSSFRTIEKPIDGRNDNMEKSFDIVTDSACDLSEEFLTENGVTCAPLGFTMNNVNYGGSDGEKISAKDFYDALRDGAMPTTYQVTGESAKEYMEQSLQKGRDVLVVAFSSALSGTCGSFQVAAKELKEKYPDRKIEVVDSLCGSMGEGLLVYYAVKKAETGATIEETKGYLEGLKGNISHNFTVDNLFHLKRGGRISSALAIVGTVLKIKPVLHVSDEGKLVAVGKAMGRKKSLQALADNMAKNQALEDGDPIFISHGDCDEDVEYLKNILKGYFPGHEFVVNYVGPVIGCHAGAGVVALFYKANGR